MTEPVSTPITAVLLPDGWHDVKSGTYSLVAADGGAAFSFVSPMEECFEGPATSVLATRRSAKEPTRAVPPWCGDCNEKHPPDTFGQRQLDGPDGVVKCPVCHPYATQLTASVPGQGTCSRCRDTEQPGWILTGARSQPRGGLTRCDHNDQEVVASLPASAGKAVELRPRNGTAVTGLSALSDLLAKNTDTGQY